jgi:ubiquinone/menaquinone biosynthesis C-methylase UbiE
VISASVYDNQRLARGYAFDRPTVHPAIIARLREHLPHTIKRALDLGCGAGLSTAALASLTDCFYGIEPYAAMLKHRRAVCEQANFVVAKAEHLPFADNLFDLVTAAGALNYTDLSLVFPETARVLSKNGFFVIYDFSEGCRLRDDSRLESWYESFRQRYPSAPGYAMNVVELEYEKYGMKLIGYQELQIAVPLNLDRYLRYVMSETRVEQAIAGGLDESTIRDWCNKTLAEIFDEQPREVWFDTYLALASRKSAA